MHFGTETRIKATKQASFVHFCTEFNLFSFQHRALKIKNNENKNINKNPSSMSKWLRTNNVFHWFVLAGNEMDWAGDGKGVCIACVEPEAIEWRRLVNTRSSSSSFRIFLSFRCVLSQKQLAHLTHSLEMSVCLLLACKTFSPQMANSARKWFNEV